MKTAPAATEQVHRIETASIAVALFATIALAGHLLTRSKLGYDFSDEGFYLNWISQPSNFPKSLTQFGFIYHPLYELVGRNISSLRQANILISVTLAVMTSLCLLRQLALDTGCQSWKSFNSIGLSSVSASSSLLILVFASAYWLPTPSYNSLAFQSLLVASIGLCLAETDASPVSTFGWLLIGLGGFLTFMAKPPSALALGAIMTVSLLIAQKLKTWMIVLPVATFAILLAAYAWLVSGSIAHFIADMRQSLESSKALGAGHTIRHVLRFDGIQLDFSEICFLAGSSLAIATLTLASFSKLKLLRIPGAVVTFSLATFALVLSCELVVIEFKPRMFQGLQLLAVILAGITCFAVRGHFKGRLRISRQRKGFSIFFALLPFAYVVGTGNNYWQVGSSTAFFLTLSSFCLVATEGWDRTSWHQLAPLSIASLVMTIIIVEHGMAHPYRERGPLIANTVPVQVGEGGTLLVSPGSAAYVDTLQRLARGAGFQKGTPVIDLTGHYPGSLFALAAKPLGAAWLLGGYPGSNALAIASLDLASCQELARSWILTETHGPLAISPDVPMKYSIDLLQDFEIVGTLNAPTGSFPTAYQQQLLKPNRTLQTAEDACNAARTSAR